MTDETLRHYDLRDFVDAETVLKFGTFFLNAGTTVHGDPVFMWWLDTGLLQQMAAPGTREKVLGFVRENLVRRQIQLDYMSHQHDRLMQTVVVGNGHSQPMWRMFVPGATRTMMLTLMNLGKCFPSLVGKIFWMDSSWVLKSFISSFMSFFPKHQHSRLTFLGENFQSQLLNVLDSDMMNILSQFRNGTSEGGAFNSDENLPVRTTGQKEIILQSGSTHEIAMKIQQGTTGVQVEYSVEEGSTLTFVAILLEDTLENKKEKKKKEKRREQKKEKRRKSSERSCLLETRLCEQENMRGTQTVKFEIPEDAHGLMLFRWYSHRRMISWGETSLQYSIELMHTPVMGPDVDPSSSSLRSLQGGLSDNEEEEEEEEEEERRSC